MTATWRPFLNDPDNEFPPEPFVPLPPMARVQCRRAASPFVSGLVPHEPHVHTVTPTETIHTIPDLVEDPMSWDTVAPAWCLGWPVAE